MTSGTQNKVVMKTEKLAALNDQKMGNPKTLDSYLLEYDM